jgi:hypothetical protein
MGVSEGNVWMWIIYGVPGWQNKRGLYKSTNEGVSFSFVQEGPEYVDCVIWNGDPTKIAVCGVNSGWPFSQYSPIFSLDGGATWVPKYYYEPGKAWYYGARNVEDYIKPAWAASTYFTVRGNLGRVIMEWDTNNINNIAAHAQGQNFRSINMGTNWYLSNNGADGMPATRKLSFGFLPNDPDRFGYALQDIGAFLSTTGATYFAQICRMPYSDRDYNTYFGTGGRRGFIDIAFHPTDPCTIVCSAGKTTLVRPVWTINGGHTWKRYECSFYPPNYTGFLPSDPNYVFAGAYHTHDIKADDPATWHAIDFGSFGSGYIVFHIDQTTSRIFAIKSYAIIFSDDKGLTWTQQCSAPSGTSLKVDYLAVGPNDVNIIIAPYAPMNGRAGRLARYNGSTWTPLNDAVYNGLVDMENSWLSQVVIDQHNSKVIYALYAGKGCPKVFRSIDDGTTWTDITDNLPRVFDFGMNVKPDTGEVFFGSDSGSFVYPPPYYAKQGEASIWEGLASNPAPPNHAPVLNWIGNRTVIRGVLLTFGIEADDIDTGDTLVYDATGLPTGATFIKQTFSWTPTASQIGRHTITFSVSDGTDTDTEEIFVQVDPYERYLF